MEKANLMERRFYSNVRYNKLLEYAIICLARQMWVLISMDRDKCASFKSKIVWYMNFEPKMKSDLLQGCVKMVYFSCWEGIY